MNRQKGTTPVLVLILLGLLVLAAAAASYYFLKGMGRAPETNINFPINYQDIESSPTPTSSAAGQISNSDDLETIGRELDQTVIESFEDEVKSLDSEASNL